MKVIFAGFSKCGTKTMAEALRILGFTVYDFIENFEYHREQWLKIFKEGASTEYFRDMFRGVDAVTDLPSCYFWEEIHQAYPEAKLIFTQRASEEEWWRSMRNQITSGDGALLKFINNFSPTGCKLRSWGRKMGTSVFGLNFERTMFGRTNLNETLMKMTYRRHNTYFLQNAPKDQRLIYKLNEGWKPLCDFLDVPVPDVPFPHKNKGATLYYDLMRTNATFHQIILEMIFFGSLVFGIISFCVYRFLTNPPNFELLLNYPLAIARQITD